MAKSLSDARISAAGRPRSAKTTVSVWFAASEGTRAALDSIRTDPLACEFKVPESGSGKPLDYARVNVNFKEGKRSTPLYYVDRLEDCDPDTGGWYYDTDPMKADPKTIYACPANCTAFQASTKTSVEIALGCETIVK